MTTIYKQLKVAADTLDAQADSLEKAAEAIDAVKVQAAEAKTAAAKSTKTASDSEKQQKVAAAKLAPLAKTAAHAVREAGLLSSQEQEDVFASQLLTHEQALNKVAQLAKHASAPKRASVVVDDEVSDTESADANWEKRANAALTRLNLG